MRPGSKPRTMLWELSSVAIVLVSEPTRGLKAEASVSAMVATVDVDGDNRADLVVGSGPGQPSRVRVYPGRTVTPTGEPANFQDLDPFGGVVLTNGVFVG